MYGCHSDNKNLRSRFEEQGKFSVAESLCLAIIKIISKDNKNNNLSFTERKAIREMQQSKSIGIYQFNNF